MSPSKYISHPHIPLTKRYLSSLQRLALILLVCHYSVEFVFHSSRLLHYHGKDDIAKTGSVWYNIISHESEKLCICIHNGVMFLVSN